MRRRLLFACTACSVLLFQCGAFAQFTDPHTYDNTAVGTNQLELSYTHVRANASIDTSLIVAGAKLDIDQGIVDYSRYFGFCHHTMWAEASLPIAGLGGSVSGTTISGSVTGTGDSSYVLGALLKGGPALNGEQFENYKPAATLGVSLTVTAPTGTYNPNKILNLGSDRWSFKPEVGLAHPFGASRKWEVEGYVKAYFYTDNTSYHGKEILRQESLPGIEGHLSYSLNDRVWASVDSRYSFRGRTFVNGADQGNGQQNFILGSEVNLSLNSRNALVFEFAKALVHQNGPAVTGFSVKYDYTWGKGYK